MLPGAVYTIDKFSMILIDQYTICLHTFSSFLELSFPWAFLLSQQVRKSQTDKASTRLILRMAQITATPFECHQFKYRGRRPPFTTAYGRDIRTGGTAKGWLKLKYAFAPNSAQWLNSMLNHFVGVLCPVCLRRRLYMRSCDSHKATCITTRKLHGNW